MSVVLPNTLPSLCHAGVLGTLREPVRPRAAAAAIRHLDQALQLRDPHGSNGAAAEAAPGELELVAPNRFVQQWVKDRFLTRVESLALSYWGVPVKNQPVVCAAAEKGRAGRGGHGHERAPLAAPVVRIAAAEMLPATNSRRPRLNREYSFDTFVTGKANQLARAAAIQVGENPGTSYNPLFLYGGVGLGKTHLVQAIGNILHQNDGKAKIRYIHAEQYVTDVVRAYQKKAFDEFQALLPFARPFDHRRHPVFQRQEPHPGRIFLRLQRPDRGAQAGHHHLRHLPARNRRGGRPPDLAFGWGLTVAIEPPELEMRVAILQKKAESQGIELDETVAFFIAKHLRSNVRELEGALRKLIAYSQFHACDITLRRPATL